jgi:hypothetical protein
MSGMERLPIRPTKGRTRRAMPIYVLEPPMRFNHAYAGPVIERVLPLREARAACAAKGVSADACSWEAGHKCFLVIPRNGPVKDLKAYVRHERAHCNGWSENHEE